MHKSIRKLNLRDKNQTYFFLSTNEGKERWTGSFPTRTGRAFTKSVVGLIWKATYFNWSKGMLFIYPSSTSKYRVLQMSMHTKIFIITFNLDRGHYFNYIHHTIHRCVDAEHSALFLTQRWWKYWQRLSTICLVGSHLYVLVYLWIFSKYPHITIYGISNFISFYYSIFQRYF